MYECYEIDCPYCDGKQCCMDGDPTTECEMFFEDGEDEEASIDYDTTQHMMEFLDWFLTNYKVDVVFKDMTQKEFVEAVFENYCILNNIKEVM